MMLDTMEEVFRRCGIQRKRFFSGADTTEEVSPPVWNTPKNNLRTFAKFPFVVSHTGKVLLPLNHTPQKNLLWCIPRCRRFCFIVRYSGKNYTMQNNIFYILNALQ